jgi:hypothetical protein
MFICGNDVKSDGPATEGFVHDPSVSFDQELTTILTQNMYFDKVNQRFKL